MLTALAIDQLYHLCEADKLAFATTRELEDLDEIIGQERALDAIEFGVGIHHEGYNLYVMGSPGLGKHTVVHEALRAKAKVGPPPFDWCYVNNFRSPHLPNRLKLAAGTGSHLAQDMEQQIEELLNALPAAFQTDDYHRQAQEIHSKYKAKEEHISEQLDEHAKALDIGLMRTPNGFTLAPLKDGTIVGPKEFEQLPTEEQQEIERKVEILKDELKETVRKVPTWQAELHREIKALDRAVTEETVNHLFHDLEQKYSGLPNVLDFLQAVKADVIENSEPFREPREHPFQFRALGNRPEFNRYRVNVLVNNAGSQGPPVIYEDNPTYQNLLGRIEHLASQGTLITDFTLVKPGALHKANGGYLVLDAEKVLMTPFVWPALKRVIKSREIRIESIERVLSLASTISLEPEPIPTEIKVVLIGDRLLYFLLKEYDPEFIQLFKVAADFSEELLRHNGNEVLFSRLIATLVHREKLREIDRSGICRIIEQSARRAEDGERLSLHLDNLLELLQESDYWAGRLGKEITSAAEVQMAIDAQARRMGQWRERLQEHIQRGILLIDTKGSQLGRVNGLSVLELGDYRFGTATRISATARLGSGEIIDIEREVDQGGQIHSKGVLILSSYLARRYSKNQPLSLSATLAFEQTYGSIEGDSASAAELCVLLSAIGDLPLRQSLAITGSVNQHGEIQAIGGVNEKIEGFFDICEARELTGDQGVIIPASNVKDLMLRDGVRNAAAEGRFHIYAARHVEEAMELLCGLRPGAPDINGIFPEGSFNRQIQTRLLEWIALRQHYASPHLAGEEDE
ncbi:MAG: AAA family ATPase [Gammaproteobacteria bacterium]|nr:AAA family ATPase [Gammaproteobacteria bacterium]MBU1656442.1 AAA family ATPase [Gammaproteobacteria bacterium]MBU1960427.1 AAA family ATPase [Gammaproteobacteria bacterium]